MKSIKLWHKKEKKITLTGYVKHFQELWWDQGDAQDLQCWPGLLWPCRCSCLSLQLLAVGYRQWGDPCLFRVPCCCLHLHCTMPALGPPRQLLQLTHLKTNPPKSRNFPFHQPRAAAAAVVVQLLPAKLGHAGGWVGTAGQQPPATMGYIKYEMPF